ncbi:e3b9f3ce-597e-4bda-91ec-0928be282e28 [Thermothielavioides terrestris]|uniref:E3b9f3ce-597e-4bda-91ec-0928be282e28 n=1 Tax=Thermothielavioides terrestris TaxID=2587410 RepID=A0A3S5CW58_9PEZI|nr:e3b9f3ce-597e-4bda-91ec-0928be282e28 [Thermothielavioides terrestris]
MLNPYARAYKENPTPDEVARRVAAGVSPNYRGDYTLVRNRPANIPQHENCSVFITGLPPNITTHQLLAAIRDTGRVWASVVYPPTWEYGPSAAKVTFFTAEAAQTFLRRSNSAGQPGFIVGNRRARVCPDRNRVAAPRAPADHTRVLSIAGPKELVNTANLSALFSAAFVYETDDVIALVTGNVINVLEWHFGSYRCQAEWAWRRLRSDATFRQAGVRVKFERDPCDRSVPYPLTSTRNYYPP